MKIKKYFVFLLLPFLALISCSNDDLEDRYISIATVDNPDNDSKFILRLDNDKSLWISETYFPDYKPKTGQRVLADYTLLGSKSEGDNDYNVKLNDAYSILTKAIFNITPETQDSIGNDPLGLHDMWIGSNFLNVKFFYDGLNKIHFISLVKDNSKTYEDGKIHLELRHNAHEDTYRYRTSAIASFNLSSLLVKPTDTKSLELVIHVKQYDGSEHHYGMTYDPNNKNSLNIDINTFNEGKGSTVK